jgi:hypothetical protein
MFAFKHKVGGFGTLDPLPSDSGRSRGPISLHNAIVQILTRLIIQSAVYARRFSSPGTSETLLRWWPISRRTATSSDTTAPKLIRLRRSRTICVPSSPITLLRLHIKGVRDSVSQPRCGHPSHGYREIPPNSDDVNSAGNTIQSLVAVQNADG